MHTSQEDALEGASYIKDSAQQVRKMLLQMDGIARGARGTHVSDV